MYFCSQEENVDLSVKEIYCFLFQYQLIIGLQKKSLWGTEWDWHIGMPCVAFSGQCFFELEFLLRLSFWSSFNFQNLFLLNHTSLRPTGGLLSSWLCQTYGLHPLFEFSFTFSTNKVLPLCFLGFETKCVELSFHLTCCYFTVGQRDAFRCVLERLFVTPVIHW